MLLCAEVAVRLNTALCEYQNHTQCTDHTHAVHLSVTVCYCLLLSVTGEYQNHPPLEYSDAKPAACDGVPPDELPRCPSPTLQVSS